MAEETGNTELVRLAEQQDKMAGDFADMREMMMRLIRNSEAVQAPPLPPGAPGFTSNIQPLGQGQPTVIGHPHYPLGFGPHLAADHVVGPSTTPPGGQFPQHDHPQVPAAPFTVPAGHTLQRSNSDPQLRTQQINQTRGTVLRPTESYDQGHHPESHSDIERLGKTEENGLAQKLKSLEQTVKNIQGQGGKVNVSYKDLCLFPHVPLPEGFVVPKFDLYTGQSDPRVHLKIYLNKMRGIEKDELLMAYFADSLGDPATEWFIQQDVSKLIVFDDMANAFLNHYGYKIEAAPDRSSLKTITKKPSESFKEHAYRWREQAARVSPLIPDDKMVEEFVEVLDETYYQSMASAIGKPFSEAVRIGEMIERGVKAGKIVSQTALRATAQALQSGTNGFGTKKEKKEEVAMVSPGPRRNDGRYYDRQGYNRTSPPQHFYPLHGQQYAAPQFSFPMSAASHSQPLSYPQWRAPAPHLTYPTHQAPQNQFPAPLNLLNRPGVSSGFRPRDEHGKVNQEKRNEFTPIGESYVSLFQKLQDLNMLKPIAGNVLSMAKVDHTRHCAYHSGMPGHDTNDCHNLKKAIQSLIDDGQIHVEGSDAANINQNPLPDHGA